MIFLSVSIFYVHLLGQSYYKMMPKKSKSNCKSSWKFTARPGVIDQESAGFRSNQRPHLISAPSRRGKELISEITCWGNGWEWKSVGCPGYSCTGVKYGLTVVRNQYFMPWSKLRSVLSLSHRVKVNLHAVSGFSNVFVGARSPCGLTDTVRSWHQKEHIGITNKKRQFIIMRGT